MATMLHNRGEEFILKALFTGEVTPPASLQVGLFNDATDGLLDAADYNGTTGSITTEPTTGSYAKQTVAFGATTDIATVNDAGDWKLDIADRSFNVTNTTETIDAYFVLGDFQGEGDAGVVTHLLWTGSLGTTNLANHSSYTLQNAGIRLS